MSFALNMVAINRQYQEVAEQILSRLGVDMLQAPYDDGFDEHAILERVILRAMVSARQVELLWTQVRVRSRPMKPQLMSHYSSRVCMVAVCLTFPRLLSITSKERTKQWTRHKAS